MKRFLVCFALSASLLAYPVSSQVTDSSNDTSSDVQADTAAQEGPSIPPPPITIVAAPAPSAEAPPVLFVPPPAPPRITTRRSPPLTNIKGPYPTNQSPVTDFLGREDELDWFQAPAVFLPGLVEAGQRQVLEGEAIVQVPLAWSMSAHLDGDVVIEGVGNPVELRAGDVLPQVVLTTEDELDQRYTLYCTRSRIHQQSGSLLEDLVDSYRDAQWCLQDTDGDGRLDLAVALSAGAPVQKAADITPVPYEMRFGQMIPGEDSFVRFRLARVGRNTINVALDISQAGKLMQFDTMNTGGYRASQLTWFDYEAGRIHRGSILGINFDIRGADRRENMAEIAWRTGSFDRTQIVPIPWRVTTTIGY